MKYKVTFMEYGARHEQIRIVEARDEQQIKDWYGLDEWDIDYYKIEPYGRE